MNQVFDEGDANDVRTGCHRNANAQTGFHRIPCLGRPLEGCSKIRLAANGGGYESPAGRRPKGALSIVGALTGQKFTASSW